VRDRLFRQTLCALISAAVLLFCGVGFAENIDPDDEDSQYAYGENVGWLNAEPQGNGGPGVEVGAAELTGYIWAENIGWISLSCQNTGSCAEVAYGAEKDCIGKLSGYAWSENTGWISFSCKNTDSCGNVDYGVWIDPATGEFSGKAWGENIGWITFRSAGAEWFWVKTSNLADINRDSKYNAFDINMFRNYFMARDEAADVNCDGLINAKDINDFRNAYMAAQK
jgi:hypothetical protein